MSAITEGPIFRRILKGGRILDEGHDPTAIRKIVKQRCLQASLFVSVPERYNSIERRKIP